MGTIQDRNTKNLTEVEEIQKMCKNTHKKGQNDLDNHEGVLTHLVPDILECDNWALGSIITNKTTLEMELQLNYLKF